MILADTSIWIDHFRAGNAVLREHLNEGRIVIHPFVIAEVALGSLRERSRTLALLDGLPHVKVAQMNEVRFTIESSRLYNLGIGLTDAHLIVSALLNPATYLWTKDRRLNKAAEVVGIRARPV